MSVCLSIPREGAAGIRCGVVLFQATVSIFGVSRNLIRMVIYFRLVWYKVFFELKLKLLDFLSDFVQNFRCKIYPADVWS